MSSPDLYFVLLRHGECSLLSRHLSLTLPGTRVPIAFQMQADPGQNFEEFPDIVGSVTYFWKIAIPCTTAFFIIFSYSYIFTFFETVRRKIASWQRKRELEERYHYHTEK